jgi:hypothetical protein
MMIEVHIRTTVVLNEDLVKKARRLSKEPTLSSLLNSCLASWIAEQKRQQLRARLAAEYRAGQGESRRIAREFGEADREGWPSW